MYDIVIIGAGVIGCNIAHTFSKYDLKVLVLEKNCDSGFEQSMSSSAIIHSGIDPIVGTKKYQYNLAGYEKMRQKCRELNVIFDEIGAYICMSSMDQSEKFDELVLNAIDRNIEYEILTQSEIIKREPNISKQVIKAIWIKNTAVIYPFELTTALVESSIKNDVEFKFDSPVLKITKSKVGFKITSNEHCYQAKTVINAAGIYSDEIYKLVNPSSNYKHLPKKGTYFVTDNDFEYVNSIIYPVPTNLGKGVLALPTVHKNFLIGPSATYQDSKNDDSCLKTDLDFVRDNLKNLVDFFPEDKIVKLYSGIRSSIASKDFHVGYSDVVEDFYNLIGIDSPGLSSSCAIAEQVAIDYFKQNSKKEKSKYDTNRPGYVYFNHLKRIKQQQLIKENPAYGKIICRCENVSEGEIVTAIRKVNGAKNIKGTKFRVRATAGFCQGGYCEHKVAKLLARELNVKVQDIKRYDADSFVVKGESDV